MYDIVANLRKQRMAMVQTKVLNKTEVVAVFLSKQKINEKYAGEDLNFIELALYISLDHCGNVKLKKCNVMLLHVTFHSQTHFLKVRTR